MSAKVYVLVEHTVLPEFAENAWNIEILKSRFGGAMEMSIVIKIVDGESGEVLWQKS